MNTLSNVNTRRGEPHPPTPDLSSVSSPENQSLLTGVSVKYALHPDKYWYVLRVTYNRVSRAYDILRKAGLEVYLPMHYVQKIIQDKKKRVLEPLLPNIIFVYATPESITSVVKKPSHNSFINFYLNHFKQDEYGKNPPLTVGYNEMMNFINLTSVDNDVVRVTDGDFKGVTGRVARVSGQQRVVVELEGLCLVATAYVPSGFLMKIE